MIQAKIVGILIFTLLVQNQAVEESKNNLETIVETKRIKKGRKALRDKNPELFKEMKQKRKEWKGLSVEDRQAARSEWFKNNPQVQSIRRSNTAKRKWRLKLGKLKKQNPELYEKFRTEKNNWKKLSPEERKAARKAFMEANPEVKNILQGNKNKGGIHGKFREANPELADKFSQARESWKNLSSEQRKQARKQFMKDNPEIRKSLRKFKKRRKKQKKKEVSEQNGEI
tara:strand:- start:114 stop:797 length:684 start_codon:yes stop_codon:yes gene_type:complete